MPEDLKTLPCLLSSPGSDGAAGACLSDDEILGFVQGELQTPMLDRIHLHVDQCEVCQRLLAEAAKSLDVEPIVESGRTSWNTVFQPNAMVGRRYRILRLVARGGMGEVYEAYDTMLHERVALKTVASTACDSAQAVRHLMAEVQLARRITHPNVCRIYDLGTHILQSTGAEIQFLVMEYVEGECLGKRLRTTGALPLELAQSTAHQLLLGLRAAHGAGILHRDFKSENVMLRTESNGQHRAVILDFGLARALNESGRIATTQNQAQALVGTIGYMAPEQIEGGALTRSSDIYAFGVVWFEMLTGRLPFEAASPTASAIARLHRDAEAPSSLKSSIPKRIDSVVLRCLSRQRSTRYADAQEVLDALSAAEAEPASLPPSARSQGSRGWSIAAAVLLAGALGYGMVPNHARTNLYAKSFQPTPFAALSQSGRVRASVRDTWSCLLGMMADMQTTIASAAARRAAREPAGAPQAALPPASSVPAAEDPGAPASTASAPSRQRPPLLPLFGPPTSSQNLSQ